MEIQENCGNRLIKYDYIISVLSHQHHYLEESGDLSQSTGPHSAQQFVISNVTVNPRDVKVH